MSGVDIVDRGLPCRADTAVADVSTNKPHFWRLKSLMLVAFMTFSVVIITHFAVHGSIQDRHTSPSVPIVSNVDVYAITTAPGASAGFVVTKSVTAVHSTAVPPDSNTDPTTAPTVTPTAEPTAEPTVEPTVEPTAEPSAEPTAEPSAEPTADPTEAPTDMPTRAPSTIPTFVPTITPTVAPTNVPTSAPSPAPTTTPAPSTAAPSKQPTKSPTNAPTTRPSKAPTKAPSCRPSTTPTRRPTPLPGTPTVGPTIETAPPSAAPTEDPYPYQTELAFNCDLQFNGIDRFTFLDDPHVSSAVTQAFARSMNVSQDDVEVLSVVDIGARRLSLRTNSAEIPVLSTDEPSDAVTAADAALYAKHKSVLASSIKVTMQVLVVLEKLTAVTGNSSTVYNALSDKASSAVSGGTYGTLLNSILTQLGASATLTTDTTSLLVGGFTSRVTKTPQPSAQPTIAPSTAEPTAGTRSSHHQGGTTVVDIIIIVTVVGTCLLLASLMVSAYYENEAKIKRKVGPEPSLAVVPG